MARNTHNTLSYIYIYIYVVSIANSLFVTSANATQRFMG